MSIQDVIHGDRHDTYRLQQMDARLYDLVIKLWNGGTPQDQIYHWTGQLGYSSDRHQLDVLILLSRLGHNHGRCHGCG